MRARPPLLTRNFALVYASTLLYFSAQMMQIPVFPPFLRERAGASDAMIGIFIGLFSVTGVLLRPLIGRSLERHQRRTWMAIGGAVTATASVAYWTTGSLAVLIPIRLYHGIAIASFYTAAATLVSDMTPEERRAEGLSYFSMFLYLGLAIGPALGLALHEIGGFELVFAVSTGLGLGCTLIARTIGETPPPAPETVEPQPLVSREALFPALVLVFAAVGYAAGLTFTADMADAAGIGGSALYFPVLAGTVIATRFFAGRLADRFGRVAVAAPGLAIFAVSMFLEASARSLAPLLLSAVLFGIGFGVFFPSLMAFTIDRVQESRRGSAVGTFTGAFDVGFGGGAPVMGAVKGSAGYPAMFRLAGVFAFAALALLVTGARRRDVKSAGVASAGRAAPTPETPVP